MTPFVCLVYAKGRRACAVERYYCYIKNYLSVLCSAAVLCLSVLLGQ